MNEANEILHIETVKNEKGKFSFLSKSDAYYKICIEKTNIYWADHDPIYVKLKFMSDNMDEPNISTAIKSKDLEILKEKFSKAIKKGEKLIKMQENELNFEDQTATAQIAYISTYYSLAVFQVVVVIGLGLYQVISFRKLISIQEFKI